MCEGHPGILSDAGQRAEKDHPDWTKLPPLSGKTVAVGQVGVGRWEAVVTLCYLEGIHPAVCWNQLALACASRLLNFLEFGQLIGSSAEPLA